MQRAKGGTDQQTAPTRGPDTQILCDQGAVIK